MQCVVLAGGLATRMRPFTETMPKSLLPVAGRPFADHQLRWLADDGVGEVVFAIGYLGDQIRDYVGNGADWGLSVRYVDEGSALRGTGGALRLAYDEGVLRPAFAVLYGDSYLQVDVRQAFSEFERSRSDVLMTVFRNEGAFDRSNVRLDDGSVIYDKTVPDPAVAGMHHIDYGLSIIKRDAVLPLISAGDVVDLAEVYGRLSRDGRVAGLEVRERFFEIGSPDGLAALAAHLESR